MEHLIVVYGTTPKARSRFLRSIDAVEVPIRDFVNENSAESVVATLRVLRRVAEQLEVTLAISRGRPTGTPAFEGGCDRVVTLAREGRRVAIANDVARMPVKSKHKLTEAKRG